jgi:hypothetical protein
MMQDDVRVSERFFGVACFHFAPAQGADMQTLGEFVATVRATLEGLDVVESVRAADCDPTEADVAFETSSDAPDLSQGEEPYPNLPLGRYEFVLRVEQSVQASLIAHPSVRTYTDRFRVELRYGYAMPFAIIEPLEPTQRPEPSQAVQIVREALEASCEDPALPARFQSLGPSPLHAEFSLVAGAEDYDPDFLAFDLTVTATRGYDFYDFSYDKREFADEDDAFDVLMDFLSDELDLYYRIVGVRAQRIRGWAKLDDLTWAVVRLHQRRGLRGYLDRLVHGKRALNDAFVALAEFEGTDLLTESSLDRGYRDTYESDEPAWLRDLVDQERQDKSSYPTAQASSLIQLFETRRLSGLELTALLLSAVIGGLIGALVTALLATAAPRLESATNRAPARPPALECQLDLRGPALCTMSAAAVLGR